MANYKQIAERARKSAAAAKADGAQMAGLIGGAGIIGLMVGSGAINRLPDLGVPKTLLVAGAGKAIGYNASGTFSRVADGMGNAGAVIAIFQFFTTGQVSGALNGVVSGPGRSLDTERRLARQLQEMTQRRLPSHDDDSAESAVAELEALADAVAAE